jgi:hypothetical protein
MTGVNSSLTIQKQPNPYLESIKKPSYMKFNFALVLRPPFEHVYIYYLYIKHIHVLSRKCWDLGMHYHA